MKAFNFKVPTFPFLVVVRTSWKKESFFVSYLLYIFRSAWLAGLMLNHLVRPNSKLISMERERAERWKLDKAKPYAAIHLR